MRGHSTSEGHSRAQGLIRKTGPGSNSRTNVRITGPFGGAHECKTAHVLVVRRSEHSHIISGLYRFQSSENRQVLNVLRHPREKAMIGKKQELDQAGFQGGLKELWLLKQCSVNRH